MIIFLLKIQYLKNSMTFEYDQIVEWNFEKKPLIF